jgi:hypothetical protein
MALDLAAPVKLDGFMPRQRRIEYASEEVCSLTFAWESCGSA